MMNVDELVNILYEEANTKYNTYLIVFHDWDEDEIKIRVKQDINRPNAPDDEELISEYIMDNYGYKGFEMIPIDEMETIDI
ncbi:hypothetical protein [Turicibacter sanguinis]|uniref:hypothetical protein n=1 Tax=Turicibacter sanguinis TaxID=154288 RepID=UPI002941F960|nr:hypothetical protein [Turicibacter sanguinis]